MKELPWDRNITEQRKEELRARARAWYHANKERATARNIAWRKRTGYKQNRGDYSATRRAKEKMFAKWPWYQSLDNAKQRCTNLNNPAYRHYGGKGVEFRLSYDDAQRIWDRDMAWKLTRPSIDRIDAGGHYEFSNCQFIEHLDNSRKALRDYWGRVRSGLAMPPRAAQHRTPTRARPR